MKVKIQMILTVEVFTAVTENVITAGARFGLLLRFLINEGDLTLDGSHYEQKLNL